jgi:NAD(P)-dependent dehydrogenase (short-subunit alcohol dehydrogenase family)
LTTFIPGSTSIEAGGAKVAFAQAEVGTEAACIAFVNGAGEKFGSLDILVNNAGIRKYEKVDEASAASWNESDGYQGLDSIH